MTSGNKSCQRPRVLFINRSYWPDAEATGQLLTELCEDLVPQFDVTVVAGQPNQNPSQERFRRSGTETRRGVKVRRVWNSTFSKSFLPGRVVNLLTYLFAAFVVALGCVRPSIVVVETDPPLLCLLGAFLRRWHRAKLVVYLQDIYPDVAVGLGKMRNGWFARFLRTIMFGVYRSADQLIVLSQDMRELLVSSGVPPGRITCVPNWVDTTLVRPKKEENAFRARHGLDGQFVVMYSGNMGLCQRLEDVLASAELVQDRRDILFMLVGDGVYRRRLQETVRRREIHNVRFLGYEPKAKLSESLSAADLHLVPLDPRVTQCVMPSKLYGILASGTPVLAIAPQDCELSRLVETEGIGFIVPPQDPPALAQQLCWCADNRDQLGSMSHCARSLAVRHYDRKISTARFGDLLWDLLASPCGHLCSAGSRAKLSDASRG